MLLENAKRPNKFGTGRCGESEISLFQRGRRTLYGHLLEIGFVERYLAATNGAFSHVFVVLVAIVVATAGVCGVHLVDPAAARKTVGPLAHGLLGKVHPIVVHRSHHRCCNARRISYIFIILAMVLFRLLVANFRT